MDDENDRHIDQIFKKPLFWIQRIMRSENSVIKPTSGCFYKIRIILSKYVKDKLKFYLT